MEVNDCVLSLFPVQYYIEFLKTSDNYRLT